LRYFMLLEVYPGEADAGDATEIVGQSGAHVQELLHPLGTGDADVQDVFGVEVEDLGVAGQRGAAGDRPGGGQAVFVRQLAQAAGERTTQDVAHALHQRGSFGMAGDIVIDTR
jgi:hypothetical protein